MKSLRWSMVILVLALVVPAAACDRRQPVTAPSVVAAESRASTSWLSISDDAPAVGSEVVVVGNAAESAPSAAYGSFRARLNYDRSRLAFVSEVALPGAMRATNPDSGRVTVAGAAIGGFENGKLFALRFRVLSSDPFQAMSLVVDELNGVDYLNKLGTLKARGALLLDRSLRQ